MLNNNIKTAATKVYVPLTAYDRAAGHGQALAGTTMAVGGLSLSVLALKKLLEGIMDTRMAEEVKPSTAIQHDLHTRTAVIDNDLVKTNAASWTRFFFGSDESTPTTSEELSGYDKKQIVREYPGASFDSVKASRDLFYIDPATRSSNNPLTNHIIAPMAENPRATSVLLPSMFVAAVLGTPLLAKKLVDYLSDSVMESPERHTNYTEAAKEVYSQAAKDLQKLNKKTAGFFDWWSGKDEEKDHTGEYIKVHSDDGFLSPSNLLPASAGLLLAYAAWRGIKGFNKGFDSAGSDIAEQQHFLHGWKAQRKLRDYDYMPLYVDYEKEPISRSQKNKKTRRALELLEDIQDTEGIEVNPFAIEGAT